MIHKSNEQAELDKMSDRELVAYWNVLQMSEKTLQDNEAKVKTKRHIGLVDELLRDRNIIHQRGKLTRIASDLPEVRGGVWDEPEPPEVRGENYCRNHPSALRNLRSMK